MELTLIALALVSGLELLLWLKPVWRFRKPLATVLMFALAFTVGSLLIAYLSAWAVFVSVLAIYRMVNLQRLIDGRIHPDYLYHASRRTCLWLIGLQALTASIAWLVYVNHVNILSCFYVLAVLQLIGSLVILVSTLRHLRTTLPPRVLEGFADRDLPSLTVAIPARNETEALEACLESLIASNYPKLEILVLDDCSQERRTPEIIRGFAHDGVRFVAGETSPKHWLAKNHAYQQLTEEANGELLLFCGVDTRFEPDSLTALVKTMIQKKKSMLSILPRNIMTSSRSIESLIVQPSRYAWELALPRRLLGRPPVLSTCWLIRRETLEHAGGFKGVSRTAIPESHLARKIALRDDGYSFLQATNVVHVTSFKELSEQRDTAIRTRYPQLHRRPELVALVGVIEFTLLVWPLIIAGVAALTGDWMLALIAVSAFGLAAATYSELVTLTYRHFMLRSLMLMPFAALYDIGLLNYSMWKYEFDEVIWKGRNVCVPVMRIYDKLPTIDAKPRI